MENTFLYKGLEKSEEALFHDYVLEKTPAFENLLTKFAEDAKLFKASCEKFEKHDAFSVEFTLTLPSKKIMSKEVSHSINKAVDDAKDRMLTQIKKHLEQLRKSRKHQSIRTQEVPLANTITA